MTHVTLLDFLYELATNQFVVNFCPKKGYTGICILGVWTPFLLKALYMSVRIDFIKE